MSFPTPLAPYDFSLRVYPLVMVGVYQDHEIIAHYLVANRYAAWPDCDDGMVRERWRVEYAPAYKPLKLLRNVTRAQVDMEVDLLRALYA